ncbi:MAG: NAD(P)-dependent oxidoreductase, partial [Cyclobacteriaceae bacterium]|nr:NAD(P)-dependent oxidoreductase [Cyclobacteriaceae bacterium]
VNTEFSKVRFKGDMEKANKVYEGMQPLVGEDIAELILFMVTRPAHVNLADIIILPTAQASATQVHRG